MKIIVNGGGAAEQRHETAIIFVLWLLQHNIHFSSHQLRSNTTGYCPLVYCGSK